jgi:arylsulfatase A-like enzyme
LYGELTNVPLYVKDVGACRPERSGTRMTAIDVHRLALRAVGLEEPPPAAGAVQIVAEMHGSNDRNVEPSDGLLAWLDGNVKWIVSATGSVEAYDLSRDPAELRNLVTDGDAINQARVYAQAWWAMHPPLEAGRVRAHQVDTKTKERMRALGY